MTDKIDVHDLPEDQIRLIQEFVEFLRERTAKKKRLEKGREEISFAEWPLGVKKNVKRSEIYDHL